MLLARRRLIVAALLLVAVLVAAVPRTSRAQDEGGTAADLGEVAPAVRDLRTLKNKVLVFVFDVSASMRTLVPGGENGQTNLQRAREATITLIREATAPGDRVVLLTFGAGYQTVFDKTLASEGDKDALADQVPSEVGTGAGTNIRKPHHDALKLLDAAHSRPGAVVLLTDSYNDQPRSDDPAYPTYRKYYVPGDRLNKYPDTPENRDYERLLRKFYRSQYGVGVQIDATGRPVERSPITAAAPPPVEDAPAPVTAAPVQKTSGPPWPWIALGVAALGVAAFLLLGSARPVPLRVSGGPGGAKDFSLKSGQSLRLGGEGANHAFDAYPLPGVTGAPAAVVRAGRGGQFRLLPGGGPPGATPATGSNPTAGVRVFHNGLPLEREAVLGYGDEVRVSVPDPAAAGVTKEFRLKFADPTKTF
jgi:hypothetical protein